MSALVVFAAAVLIGVDHAVPEVGMGPLYIPLIAVVGWRFGLAASCMLGVVATLLNIFPMHVHEIGLPTSVLVTRGILRFGTYVFVVAIVHSFRGAYLRERASARQDMMTGALNRSAFDQQADHLLGVGRDAREMLLVAIMDLDDFKTINDTNGHSAGDTVLRAFASAALPLLPGEACLGRIGGDEFALLMPLSAAQDGHTIAGRVHQRITAELQGTRYPATFSMGAVIIALRSGSSRKDVMREADGLLYSVKAAGKGGLAVGTIGREAAHFDSKAA